MSRLFSAMKMDVILQIRTSLYTIGIGVGVLIAIALSQLTTPAQQYFIIPTLMLLVIGGSTMLYVSAMITFEKEEGTLMAIIVSPVRTSEYIWSKIITLTALASLESVVMIGGTILIMSWSSEVIWPNIPLLLIGIIAIGVIYTLVGIILIVRFDSITDFLVPMSGVAVILQLPFLYFLGWVEHPLLLIIPTSAPTIIMQGAYIDLVMWEWLYGVSYTTVLLIGLTVWAHRAFYTHIVMKVG